MKENQIMSILHKNKFITYLISVLLVIMTTQQLTAVPTAVQIIDRDILIISDYHEDVGDYAEDASDYAEDASDYAEDASDYAEDASDYAEDARNKREAYKNIIKDFIDKETLKDYETAILIEINKEFSLKNLKKIEKPIFLVEVAKCKDPLKKKISFIYTDPRGNFLCGTEGLKEFHFNNMSKDISTILGDISDDDKREELLDKANDCDSGGDDLIKYCLKNFKDFLKDIKLFTQQKKIKEDPGLLNLFIILCSKFEKNINDFKTSFDFISDETTLLDAVFEKMKNDNSKEFLEDVAAQIREIGTFMFDISTLMELFQNRKEGKRLIIFCGAFHAECLIYYLNHIGHPEEIERSKVETFVSEHLKSQPMLPKQFEKELNKFASLHTRSKRERTTSSHSSSDEDCPLKLRPSKRLQFKKI